MTEGLKTKFFSAELVMSTPTFYINDVFIAGDEAAKWNEEQWKGIINKVLPAGKNSVIIYIFSGPDVI